MLESAPLNNNGIISCYNMMPDNFTNIAEMTAYLEELHKLEYNVVWVNPLQLAGHSIIEKADMLTGQQQQVKSSLYAMKNPKLLDPRFSMVKRDKEGDIQLSRSQITALSSLVSFKPSKVISAIQKARIAIAKLEKTITSITSKKDNLKNQLKRKKQSFEYDLIASDLQELERVFKNENAKLEKQKHIYQANIDLQYQCIEALDTLALQAFTRRAVELGITPIFDLVLNHVANDNPLVSENEEFFNLRDRTYRDATAFAYGQLSDIFANRLTNEKRKQLVEQIPTIIEKIWLPFIDRYINTYGFFGARIDCVRKLPQELREQIYEIIHQYVKAKKSSLSCIILEETLFSDMSADEFAKKVKSAKGATYNTGSAYYRKRLWHGGLEENYNNEDFHKRSMVQNGVVNFSGNHDHYSCAMTVCRELAFERLQANSELYASYLEYIRIRQIQNDKPLSDAVLEQIKTQYIHYYVKEIMDELNDPDQFNDMINRFGIAFRDKILTSAFSGSGGYFILSGDEVASLHLPSIFLRDNDERVYPQKQLAVFESHFAATADAVITQIAETSIVRKKYGTAYKQMNPENQHIFLSAVKEQIRNEIHANIGMVKIDFADALKKALGKNFKKNLLDEKPKKLTSKNRWRAPKSLTKFVDRSFFQQTNRILRHLPASKDGFWSELFKAVNDEILIALRQNGNGYTAQPDVIIFNLNPHKEHRIALQDLEKIALWLQKRGFRQNVLLEDQTPDYHKSYGCIMGSSMYNLPPANLYFGGQIEIDSDILEYRVNQQGFKIVVAPEPIQPDPLLSPAPGTTFISDAYSQSQLLSMFKGLKLCDFPLSPKPTTSASVPASTSTFPSESEDENSDFFDSCSDDDLLQKRPNLSFSDSISDEESLDTDDETASASSSNDDGLEMDILKISRPGMFGF